MDDVIFRLLMGHFMGDYLFQPLVMALNKSPRKPLNEEGQKSEGRGGVPLKTALFWSLIHCTVYSLSVCLWLWGWQPIVMFLEALGRATVSLGHWPLWPVDVDALTAPFRVLGSGLLALDWHPALFVLIFLTHWPLDFYSLGDKWLRFIRGRTLARAAADTSPFHEFNVAFTAVVYTIVDNGLHLMLMYPVVLALQSGLI